MRRVQLQGGARGPHARRTPCTLSVRPRAPTPQMGPSHRSRVLRKDWTTDVEALAGPNDPQFGSLWGLQNSGQTGGTPGADIDALRAWGVTAGSSGVVVTVIDTGIDYTHPDLADNMFRNTADCNADGVDDDLNGHVDDCYGIDVANNDSDPMDDNRHGTHVSGTIGAVGNN